MVSGYGYDRWSDRRRIAKALSDEFKCTWCRPHGGENEGRRHGKYRRADDGSWSFHPSKDKARK